MTVGIPGAGIGGAFYLVSALLMPLRESVRSVRRGSGSGRWRTVGLQVGLAFGILAGIALAGVLLGWAVSAVEPMLAARMGEVAPGERGAELPLLFGMSAIALMFGTLVLVLASVHALRLLVRR